MCRRRATLLVVVFVISLCDGCAAPSVQMYDGPALTTDKQAVVKVAKRNRTTLRGTLGIVRVDGSMTVNTAEYLINPKWAASVTVLPGKHTILVKRESAMFYSIGEFWFVAEPSKEYVVNADDRGYGVRMWIEDETTGKPVGGILGSQDEPPN